MRTRVRRRSEVRGRHHAEGGHYGRCVGEVNGGEVCFVYVKYA